MIHVDGGIEVRIVVPRENAPGERRVPLVPESCKKLIHAGYDIAVEAGAGDAAGLPDQGYSDAAVSLSSDSASLLADADVVLKVGAPSAFEIERMSTSTARLGV